MKTLQVNQLKKYLEKEFKSYIDLNDVPYEQKNSTFLSR